MIKHGIDKYYSQYITDKGRVTLIKGINKVTHLISKYLIKRSLLIMWMKYKDNPQIQKSYTQNVDRLHKFVD